MKNTFVAILSSLSILGCTALQDVAKPIAESPSTLQNSGKPAASGTLRAEFEALADRDQEVRKDARPGMDQKALRAMWEKTQVVDTANQLRLDELVKQHGWPEATDLGAKAVMGAYAVVQHAPREYMQRYSSMVQKSTERGDISKADFARFDDRLRMRNGQPQRYGTQVNTDVKGISTFWKIEDEENVDKRRAEVGYEPLAEFAKRHKVSYVPYAERIAAETPAKSEAKK